MEMPTNVVQDRKVLSPNAAITNWEARDRALKVVVSILEDLDRKPRKEQANPSLEKTVRSIVNSLAKKDSHRSDRSRV